MPDRSHFVVALPAGTNVIDFDDRAHWFTTRQAEQVHVDDLPRVYEMAVAAKSKPQMDTALPASSPNRALWYVVGGSFLTLGAGGYYFLRRRRPGDPLGAGGNGPA